MALIKCPECGKEISEQAEYCIHCGYPIKHQNNNYEEKTPSNSTCDANESNEEIQKIKAVDSPPKKTTKKINAKKIGLIVGILAAIVITAILVIVINGSGGRKNSGGNGSNEDHDNSIQSTTLEQEQENKITFSMEAKPVDGKEYQHDDFVYIIYDDDSIEIIKYLGEDDSVTISEEINGYAVSRIGESAFENCTFIENVYIYANIVSIGDYAFKNCTSLEDITIPEGILGIGVSAFEGCTDMTNVYLFGGETIGDCAFKNCTSLEDITIPEGITSIGVSAFEGCTGMTNVYLFGGGIIGDCAFKSCTSLEDVTIPEEITSIGVSAFEGCTDMTNIYLFGGGTIGDCAFKNCASLEDVTIPEEIISVGVSAFEGCSRLEDVYVYSEDVTYGVNAFANCPKLEKLPEGAYNDYSKLESDNEKETTVKSSASKVTARKCKKVTEKLLEEDLGESVKITKLYYNEELQGCYVEFKVNKNTDAAAVHLDTGVIEYKSEFEYYSKRATELRKQKPINQAELHKCNQAILSLASYSEWNFSIVVMENDGKTESNGWKKIK